MGGGPEGPPPFFRLDAFALKFKIRDLFFPVLRVYI